MRTVACLLLTLMAISPVSGATKPLVQVSDNAYTVSAPLTLNELSDSLNAFRKKNPDTEIVLSSMAFERGCKSPFKKCLVAKATFRTYPKN